MSCAASIADDASSGMPRRGPSRTRARHRHGCLRRDDQAARLQIDEQLLPALPAFPHARLKADQPLRAFGRRAHQHQHAFGLWLHPRLQIDAVRPDVDVMARRQIALLPSSIFVLPFALEARDHRWGKVGRFLAEQGGEGLLEIAGGNPAQIQNGQKGIEALGAPRPFGQDVRREANALARSGGAIAAFGFCTSTGPIPVRIARTRSCPWRTTRRRPSGSTSSAVEARNVSNSASTAWAINRRAPVRRISVSGSSIAPFCRRATSARSSFLANIRLTAKQGQYLAFIHAYRRLLGQSPAEADMQRFFQVTSPSVHQMVLSLEKAGLITRQPGIARSITLTIDPADLPELASRYHQPVKIAVQSY